MDNKEQNSKKPSTQYRGKDKSSGKGFTRTYVSSSKTSSTQKGSWNNKPQNSTDKKIVKKTSPKKVTDKKSLLSVKPMRRMTKKSAQVGKSNGKHGALDWKKQLPPLKEGAIRIIPLGGVEEIGRNMTIVEYNDQIIVVDAGIGFEDPDTPGIDYVIPNIKYLQEYKHKVKALVITHGHLDHIGGIPYVLNAIGNPPIYTREFGGLLIKSKCSEFPEVKPNVIIVEEHDGSIKLSEDFKVSFFGLTHSIPDSTGVILETPFGDIVSTGDVRVENRDGVPDKKEFEQYKLFKDRDILLMTMDSTGITAPGWSRSESEVVENLDKMIKDAPGRLIIGAFASQVERLMEFIKSATKYGKYIIIDGRSMKTNLGIAMELKLADFKNLIPVEEIDDYPANKIVMIMTGSQGEEFAALMRMANQTHKFIRLHPTDTVILSASVIPGNETAVDKLKDNLFRSEANIVTYIDNIVHASGHGKKDELAWIHEQIDYKFFMPIHGHHYRLRMHATMAEKLGAPKENIVVPDNGSVIDIEEKGTKLVKRKEKVPGDVMIVDGLSISDSQHLVLRDRKMLAQDGIFTIVIMIDTKKKKLKKSPDIISRGFVVLKENQELLKKTRSLIKDIVETSIHGMNPIDFDFVKDEVSKKITKHLMQQTGKKPVVIPVILGI